MVLMARTPKMKQLDDKKLKALAEVDKLNKKAIQGYNAKMAKMRMQHSKGFVNRETALLGYQHYLTSAEQKRLHMNWEKYKSYCAEYNILLKKQRSK